MPSGGVFWNAEKLFVVYSHPTLHSKCHDRQNHTQFMCRQQYSIKSNYHEARFFHCKHGVRKKYLRCLKLPAIALELFEVMSMFKTI